MADFRRAFDLDIFSLFQLTQLAAIEMEKAGGGAMLTATSIAGENKNKRMAFYGLSKAVTNNLIRNIAFDLCLKGIRINGVVLRVTHTKIGALVLTTATGKTIVARR